LSTDGARRTEILETAASLFASAGLRTSLKEIADACNILPGSLYHHFDSKEAIVLELVRRYVNDLELIANEALAAVRASARKPIEESIIEFGRMIASCGIKHRAALLLTLYEPPAVLGDELARLASQAPAAIEPVMGELLGEARSSGVIRSEVDLSMLADRLCQSMLHIGVGVSHLTPGGEHVPELRLRIPLHGIALRTPSNAALDRSESIRAVRAVTAAWGEEPDDDDRIGHLRAVARKEFGRRGYEATTMRDVAASAGLSTGTVYRFFNSKDELLVSIMGSYSAKVKRVWDAALHSKSSPLERLDALMWANIHIVDRFSDEFRIQLAWLRQSPPNTPNLGFSFLAHLRQIKALLAEGAKSGDMRVDGPTADLRARCLWEAIVFPPNIMRAAGTRAAQSFARETVLRGAMLRSRPTS
jgi:AcrR family transcriptional regulator